MKTVILYGPKDLRLDESPRRALGGFGSRRSRRSVGRVTCPILKAAVYLAADASLFHTGDILIVDGGRTVSSH